jgi:hypothetical protein
MTDSESIRLLRSIDRRLALLSGAEDRRMRARLVSDLLRAPGRTAMFDAIDGKKGSPDLALAAKVSDRAAQLFVKELLDLGLVRIVPDAAVRGVVVERDEDALVAWYLERVAGDRP